MKTATRFQIPSIESQNKQLLINHVVHTQTCPSVHNCTPMFLYIPSQYLVELPLVFIFGIATSVAAIHRILPQDVSSLLSIEKFQAQPSTVYLGQLISKVSQGPRLGPCLFWKGKDGPASNFIKLPGLTGPMILPDKNE